MGLPETGAIPDWCHTSPSKTNFELCEPEKKNSPLLKTLVPQPTSCGSGLGTLTTAAAANPAFEIHSQNGDNAEDGQIWAN